MPPLRTVLIIPLAASLACGCVTHSSTARTLEKDGRRIPGSESLHAKIAGLRMEPVGREQRLIPEIILAEQTYMKEKILATWTDLERKRFLAVAGVHDDYNFVSDILLDPIFACVVVFALPFALLSASDPNSSYSGPTGSEVICAFSLVIAVLPFVASADIKGMDVEPEHIRINESERVVSKQAHRESLSVNSLGQKRIKWTVQTLKGKKLGSGFSPLSSILVPWCDWAMANPMEKAFTVQFAAEEVELSGRIQFDLPVDWSEIPARMWPDSSTRPEFLVTLENLAIVDGSGAPLEGLFSGRGALLTFTASNPGRALAAYQITPVISTTGTDVKMGTIEPLTQIGPGERVKFRVPIQCRRGAPTGTTRISVVLKDAFGRSSPELDLNLPIHSVPQPEPHVFTAILQPHEDGQGNATHDLVLSIRNRGEGDANNFTVRISYQGAGANEEVKSKRVMRLEPRKRTDVIFPLILPNESILNEVTVNFEDDTGQVMLREVVPPARFGNRE